MAARNQRPIGSGFNARTTAAEVLEGTDLTGKNVVVTGGYSGIGLETTKALAFAGAQVTVPARRPDVASKALADVANVDVASLDLADLSSVRAFADAYVASGKPLDILINNAGIMACPETRVGPGWEAQFGVNHLGHMALATSLLPALRRAQGARVVALSSTAHIITDVHWDDIHFKHTEYDKWQAYGQAKSANALFAVGLDGRERDSGIRALSVHPGGIFTPLQRHLPEEEMVALGWKNADGTIPSRVRAMFKTPEQGASTSVWAATSPLIEDVGGVYCEDCDVAQLATEDSQRWEHVREWVCDEDKANQLWALSEKMLAES